MARYKTHMGKFRPNNPQKYKGDPTNIIYRSLWELKFMIWCDKTEDVLEYSSEEFSIPYRDPSRDFIIRRYFPDFLLKIKKADGSIAYSLIEIKPKAQTIKPEPNKKVSKKYINEILTWGTNNAKWEAAQTFAKARNWEFKILTEDDLNIK